MVKKYKQCLVLVAIALGSCANSVAQTPATLSGNLVEFHQRNGLPNFFKKTKSGRPITVAYIGGSITEASHGWRDMSFDWLVGKYPTAAFKQVDATVGGTGSNLGVFRMDQDVLSHKPDLLFVEFATNDGGPAEGIYRSIEGIVRKTWRQNPNTDICFVYTVAEINIKALQGGNYQNTAAAMEKIAEHYHIPSIHMGVEVIKLLDSGKLVFTGIPEEHPDKIVFTKDRTHPLSASGHPIYLRVVARSFEKMENVAADVKHALPEPYIKDNWDEAQMVPLSKLKVKNDWETLAPDDSIAKKFTKYMPVLYKAKVPGASFTIKFNGKVLGVYDLVGPKSGIVDVVIDGQPPIQIFRFDQWANNYRKNAFFLKDLPDGDHTVTFNVTGRAFDKAKLLAIKKITITDPSLYAENSWFVNNILIVGKLID
jgi:hypothetical protein